jgi:hypothetical protein
MGKWADRQFSKEEVQVPKKYTKKCSTSSAMKKMQIKMTLRFHLTLVRMAMIKNTTNAGEDVGKGNPYPLLVGM